MANTGSNTVRSFLRTCDLVLCLFATAQGRQWHIWPQVWVTAELLGNILIMEGRVAVGWVPQAHMAVPFQKETTCRISKVHTSSCACQSLSRDCAKHCLLGDNLSAVGRVWLFL